MALTQISTGMLASGDGTVDLNIDNGTFVVDVSTSRVGIGTVSPSYPLEVAGAAGDSLTITARSGDATAANNAGGGFRNIGSATATSRKAQVWLDADGANLSGGDYFYIEKQGSSGDVIIGQYSNADMIFQVNGGNERMRIDASGSVGIGTSLYPQKFNVLGTHENAGFYRDYSASGVAATYLQIGRKDSNGDLVSGVRIAGGGDNGVAASHNGYFEIATRKAGTFVSLLSSAAGGQDLVVNEAGVDMDFRVESDNSTHALFVQGSDGKVGIGTDAPTANLEVVDPVSGNFAGKIHIGGTGSGRRLVLEQSDVLTYKMGGTGTNAITQLVSGGSSGVGTVRMTIDENGVTTFNSSVTATALTLNTSGTSSFSIVNGGTNAVAIKSAAGDELYIGANNSYALRLLNDGTNNVVMDNGGNLGVVGTATTANQARVSVGTTVGAKAGVLNVDSSGTSVAGGIRHRMTGGTQYLNVAAAHTGSGSLPYWHIKTNIYYTDSVMFVARVHGYAYGNSGHVIDMQRSGYAYAGSNTALVGSQFVNNGSGTVDSLVPYYTSAGQLCFRAYSGASSYYTGWAFDIKMQSPTGYNFNFVVETHNMNATSGNYYT
jgi:hypothetical protein